jgi:PilZ domain
MAIRGSNLVFQLKETTREGEEMKPAGPAPLRRSVRVQVRVPVTVSGKFADGTPFREQGQVVTISKYGAKLKTGLPLKVGSEVRVQPQKGSQPALFRVVWVGREGTPRAGEIGIEYVRVSSFLGVTFPE